jgi:hypothetical protein
LKLDAVAVDLVLVEVALAVVEVVLAVVEAVVARVEVELPEFLTAMLAPTGIDAQPT